jgi:D-alanyl-D-alanine carboxypeptidase (penicillin-binding protein 5/6)
VTGASLIVADSGQQLYAVDPNRELPIASTTKLMTALVTLQHVTDLNQIFTQYDWRPAPVDSQIGLIPGERMSVHDLLTALLLPSADDAAMDLAYNIGGHSLARFVAMMNAEAAALHLDHTHYATPSGLDTAGNYSSAADLVTLADYVLQSSPFFRRTVAMPRATLYTGRYVRYVTNTDDLVGRVPWITGVKTGHTTDAGYVLVTSGTRDGMTLIGSVLGTDSEAARDANALALLNYGFAAFHQVTPLRAGQVLARPAVSYSASRAVVVATGGFQKIVPRSDRVWIRVRVPAQLTGPMRRGTRVGTASVIVGRQTATEIPLELAHTLPAVSLFSRAIRILRRPSTLVLLALALVAALTASRLWRRRPRAVAASHLEER